MRIAERFRSRLFDLIRRRLVTSRSIRLTNISATLRVAVESCEFDILWPDLFRGSPMNLLQPLLLLVFPIIALLAAGAGEIERDASREVGALVRVEAAVFTGSGSSDLNRPFAAPRNLEPEPDLTRRGPALNRSDSSCGAITVFL